MKNQILSALFASAAIAASMLATQTNAQPKQGTIIDVAIGKACWVEAYTNSAATWTMTIWNGDQVAVQMRGSGVNFNPMSVVKGNPRFNVKGGVVALFKSSITKAETKSVHSILVNSKGDPAAFNTFIGGEDGGDDDWQDIIANVTCLHHAG